ncbi:MAG: hypothetical protein M1822_004090 [Bathelium mastoideum]|nr:MAG: hypothetical protein M1822_004090 [Bathelium mastoideum]
MTPSDEAEYETALKHARSSLEAALAEDSSDAAQLTVAKLGYETILKFDARTALEIDSSDASKLEIIKLAHEVIEQIEAEQVEAEQASATDTSQSNSTLGIRQLSQYLKDSGR